MLDRKQKYLQIALNSTLEDAETIINRVPLDKRIIIEAGTPLIKTYGMEAVEKIKSWWAQRVFGLLGWPSKSILAEEMRKWPRWFEKLSQLIEEEPGFFFKKTSLKPEKSSKTEKVAFSPYIVADLKCMDRGMREVEIAQEAGASAAVALGQAPIETLNVFIEECEKFNLDSMVDMMNVEFPLTILRQLKKPPQVVILHRGVDEETFDPESEIPFHEIARVKNEYDIMVAIAGGDTFQEVQRAIFNDADIVVVWKSFYKSTIETAKLAGEFLREIL